MLFFGQEWAKAISHRYPRKYEKKILSEQDMVAMVTMGTVEWGSIFFTHDMHYIKDHFSLEIDKIEPITMCL